MKKSSFDIDIAPNRFLSGDLRISEFATKMPIAIIMHGFKGNRDWGFLPAIAETFAQSNYITVNYDHSLNGKIARSAKFDIDKFRRMTVSSQLDELAILISSITSGLILPDLDIRDKWNGEIALCGHSMGAAIALLYAAENSNIEKLILLAPISKFDRYSERQKKQWRIDGKIEFYNPNIDQTMILDSTFIDDLDEYIDRFDLLNAISDCTSDVLIVHGEQDLTVKIDEAHTLLSNSVHGKCTLRPFPHCNHSFNIDTLGTIRNQYLNELQRIISNFI